MLAIHGAGTASQQQFRQFLADECLLLGQKGANKTYSFEAGQSTKFHKLKRRVQRAKLARPLVPRGLLVALVSQFDAYVGALIRQLFKLKPEIVESSASTMTFSRFNRGCQRIRYRQGD
jgi:hypothetical protein